MQKGYFLVFLTAVISGFSVFINKFGVSVVNPFVFTGLKNLSVAIFLAGLIFILKDWRILKSLSPKQWFLLALIGLIGGSIPFLLFFKGLSLTSAVLGGFWHKTMFIYVAVLAAIFLKEKIDKKFLFGGLLLVLGNILLLKQLSFTINYGDVLIVLATLFWASENIISKHILRDLKGNIVAWARMFFGALFIFIFLLATGQASSTSSLSLAQAGWVLATSLLLFAYSISWYNGLKYIPASHATAILVLGSPITTLLSFISSGIIGIQEITASSFIIAGILIILGLSQILKLAEKAKKLVYGYVRA